MAAPAELERARLVQEALLGRLVPDLVHQLRNPLNAILASAVLLQERADSEAMREKLLPVLLRSAERMRTLLSGLGDVPALDAEQGIDLIKLLDSALAVLSSRRHTITVHPLADGAPVMVAGEGDLLWPLLLCILEEGLCAAETKLSLSLVETSEQVALTITHDGSGHTSPVRASGPENGFAEEAAAALGGSLEFAERADSGMRIILTLGKHPQKVKVQQ